MKKQSLNERNRDFYNQMVTNDCDVCINSTSVGIVVQTFPVGDNCRSRCYTITDCFFLLQYVQTPNVEDPGALKLLRRDSWHLAVKTL